MTREEATRFAYRIQRALFDIFILVAIGLSLLVIPESVLPVMNRIGFMNLFLNKLVFVSAGMAHAHIGRLIYLHYIDFKTERRLGNQIAVTVWYAVVIYAWSIGG